VIFFNNRGFLGMCGHGTIGVLVTLAHLGRIGPGEHVLETPVGPIRAILHDNNQASFTNVPSFRYRTTVAVAVPEYGNIVGDVAWGGNWFFLVNEAPVELLPHNVEALTEFTWRIRGALDREGITGEGGAEIDHIEISGPPVRADADGRNFVLCPGKMYDRSPCGTGTSAKMACLLADGRLKEGDLWRQEGILGTRFEGVATIRAGKLCPTIRGSAYITGESNLLFDPLDPLSQRLDA
jgi:4-hydroxyproline epimerase